MGSRLPTVLHMEAGGGEGECLEARLAHSAAVLAYSAVMLSWPLDPTPLHFIAAAAALANLTQAQLWMERVCAGQ
jgi:hypothetical protein